MPLNKMQGLILAQSVVEYEVLYKEGTTNQKHRLRLARKLRYCLLVLPTFLLSLVFRLGSLVILFSYLQVDSQFYSIRGI